MLRYSVILFLLLLLTNLLPLKQVWSQEAQWSQTVSVSNQSQGGAEARESALQSAQQSALQKLLASLGVSSDIAKSFLGQAPSFVKDLEILEEKFAGAQYRARVSVTFHREKIEKILTERHIAFDAKALEHPPLIVAVELVDPNDTLGFHKENSPWPQKLQSSLDQRYKAVFPLMDSEDMSYLKDLSSQSSQLSGLSDLLVRYDASELMLVIISPHGQGASLLAYQFSGNSRRSLLKEEISVTGDQLYEEAAKRTVSLLTQKGVASAEKSTIQLVLTFQSFDQWSKMMAILNQAGTYGGSKAQDRGSSEMTVAKMKKGRALVAYPLSVPEVEFHNALTSQGLKITQKSGYLEVSF